MDRLPPETQEQLKKMSTAHLAAKLGRAGYDPDRLEDLERAELLEALAETMLAEPTAESETDFLREAREASQVPLPAGDSSSAASEGGSAAVRLRELELEERRAEREERQAVREAEERKAAREAQKLALEAEQRRLEVEERREQRAMEERRRERELEVTREQAERDARLKAEQVRLEHEIRLIELKAHQAKPGDTEGVDGRTPSDPSGAGNLALQTKRFGKVMRHVLPKMPQESAELPQFFETVEKLYAMYEVPAEVQAKLLIPLLTAQAKSLVNQMTIDDMSKYDELKKFLLTEYKLTPREYKIRFETAVKNAGETYTLFAARLRNLLSYYLKSRLVEDYETLIELLISDRLKGSLPQELPNYVLTQEGEGWYVASKVASLADMYVNNRATVIGQKASEGKPVKIATVTSSGTAGGQNHYGARGGQSQVGSSDGQAGQQSPTQARRWQCYNCGEFGHISRTVPRNEPTLVMVHHRLQGRVGSSATTAQDGATWPEIVRQSRVADVVVPGEVGEADIEAVPEVMDRTEESVSTWCRRAE